MVLLSLHLLAGATALASPADVFGHGAATVGRGGGGFALLPDGGSALANPAGVAARERGQFMLGYELIRFDLDLPSQVYWDTNRDGLVDASDAPLELDRAGYDPGDGMVIGLAQPLGERMGVALSVFYPKDRLLRLDTYEPSIPTYFMHRNRVHRYAISTALSGEPARGLQLGAGLRVISRSIMVVQATIDGQVAGEPGPGSSLGDVTEASIDIHGVRFDLVPLPCPFVTFRWEPGELVPALEGLALAGGWRASGGLPVEVDFDAQINLRAEDVGDLEPVAATLIGQGTMVLFDHYIPSEIQAGIAYSFKERANVYADVRHTWWSGMRHSISTLEEASFSGTLVGLEDVTLDDSNDLSEVVLRDTTAFRLGGELFFDGIPLGQRLGAGRLATRLGGGLEPSPLVSQGPETALLDSDRLVFGAGLGLEHGPLRADGSKRHSWDVFGQLHMLASGTLERPDTAAPKAGYPVDGATVPIGGKLLTSGAQWSVSW